MSDPIELAFNGGVDCGMAVTVNICPDGGIAIDVLAALPVPENCAAALNEHERVVLWGAPGPHLSKGMPEVSFFSGDEQVDFHVRK